MAPVLVLSDAHQMWNLVLGMGSLVTSHRLMIFKEGFMALKNVTVRVSPEPRAIVWGMSQRITSEGTLTSVTL